MRWLERFSLGEAANKVVRGFSKGMAQRTALAHAMVVEPRLLILDEPLSGLDPIGRRDVVEILSEYHRQGGTIFLTSHVLHDVERLADRFGMIHKGELKTIQSPNELVGDQELVTVRSVGEGQVAGMTAESGGRWFVEVRRSALWSTLQEIDKAGHTLIEVKPTLTLESAFLRYSGLGEGAAPPKA
jgi:ABC-2 type transport system ATP-binding protein